MSSGPPFRIAFIGSAGLPNRYGGFESFLEQCAPRIAEFSDEVVVTCDASLYTDRDSIYQGVRRIFLKLPANGASSILHDLVAFLHVWWSSTHIVVLGVSGGPWFPLWRILCFLRGSRLLVNIDGVEWRRTKFSAWRRLVLRLFDISAQLFAHTVIYDNEGLAAFVISTARKKATCIAYSGDHVLRLPAVQRVPGTALTICRIEPENNLDLLLAGAVSSGLSSYTVVGNWDKSEYGQALRRRYASEPRLILLDPVYDAQRLAQLREACDVYIHGHSVGGTNPSLVEMLFYDCRVLAFDCTFNRYTGGGAVEYFSDEAHLVRLIAESSVVVEDRSSVRTKYSRDAISKQYFDAMQH